jgi:hypothetical protein
LWSSPCFTPPAVARRSSPPHRAAPPRGSSSPLLLRRPHRPSWFPRRPRCVLVQLVHEAEPPQLNPVCSAAARRRALSPAAVVATSPPASARMRFAPPDRDPAGQIESCHHLNPQATATIRSRSNGSGSSQLESASQTPAGPGSFAENPPSFLIFTRIPFHLRKFPAV